MSRETSRTRVTIPIIFLVAESLLVLCLLGVFVYLVFPFERASPVTLTPIARLVELTAVGLDLGSIPTMAIATPDIPMTVNPSATFPATGTTTASPSPTPILPQGRIVFTCTPEDYNQICMVDADGKNTLRLTDRRNHDYYPSLSPQGDRVVFSSNQTGVFEIFTLDLLNRIEFQVTHEVGNVTAPELSPQGDWIVFANKWFDDSSIWLIRPDGSQGHAITDQKWNEIDPTWSPDGQRIAFAGVRGGYVELFTMRADGTDIQQVTRGTARIGGRSSWSPDGRYLAFYAGPQEDRDIYLVEITSGSTVRLTDGGNNTGPSFSPDGRWIVFSSSRQGDYELYVMRTDGSQVTQITDNDYDDWQPRWER